MLQETKEILHFDDLLDLLSPQLTALVEFLEGQTKQFEPEIQEHISYCLQNQGKHFRPILLFISGLKDDSVDMDQLVRAASVLELVHIATLVHDDIIDEAAIRRNLMTAYHKFGSDIAVLLGDALFSHALELASDFPTPDVCKHVSHATRQVCSGEILQSLSKKENRFSKEHYFKVINLKTAELFEVACKLGAILAQYPKDFVDAIAQAGRYLGIAYQIFDDMTDLFSDQETLGKSIGTDIKSGKCTLPILLLLEKLPQDQASQLRQDLINGSLKIERLNEFFETYEIRKHVLSVFSVYISKVRELLLKYPDAKPSIYLEAITGIIEKSMVDISTN